MSTTPGDSTWADAGLVPPDSSAPQDPSRTTAPVQVDRQPRAAKPDLRDEGAPVDVDAQRAELAGDRPPTIPEGAPEADAWEQAQDADGDPDEAAVPQAVGDREASEADVLEQSVVVPDDDEDSYRA
jgi:hypothetical protein